MKEYTRWLENCTGELLEELKSLEGNEAEIRTRFGSKAAFGTAGIRSIMGAGTAWLNELTVRQTARGLAAYVLASDESKTFLQNVKIMWACKSFRRVLISNVIKAPSS